MKYSKWIGLLACIAVLIVCYRPWIKVPSVPLIIGGMSSSGTQNFGKPGLINIICTVGAVILFILPKLWAKRTNIFFCGFNIAWAIRNVILLSRCYGGDCPQVLTTLYILIGGAALMLLMAFVPTGPVQQNEL